MSESTATTKHTQSAQPKRTEPPQQPQRTSALHPANWLQLSFELSVPTALELWQERREAR